MRALAAGTVGVHGPGYSVDACRDAPWIASAPIVTYRGDLDSHGLAILDRLRAHVPQAESALMNTATLHRYLDLCGPEPCPTRAQMPRLTLNEARAREELAVLRDLRLEQERLPWERCLDVLGLGSC